MWHVPLIKPLLGEELPVTSNAFLTKIEINGGKLFSDPVREPFGDFGWSEMRPFLAKVAAVARRRPQRWLCDLAV